jgi:uncharacterized membrane protein
VRRLLRVYHATVVTAVLMIGLVVNLAVAGERPGWVTVAVVAATLVLAAYNRDYWRDRCRRAEQANARLRDGATQRLLRARIVRLGQPAGKERDDGEG